jgi:hypothetical protein
MTFRIIAAVCALIGTLLALFIHYLLLNLSFFRRPEWYESDYSPVWVACVITPREDRWHRKLARTHRIVVVPCDADCCREPEGPRYINQRVGALSLHRAMAAVRRENRAERAARRRGTNRPMRVMARSDCANANAAG